MSTVPPPTQASPRPPQRTSLVESRLAANRLGAGAIVLFIAAAATPLTVVAGVATTGWAMTGLIALPVAFAVVAAVLAIFSAGYVTMAAKLPHAGAFYAFIAAGIGRAPAVGGAWIALAAYTALQVGLYGLLGISAQPLLAQIGIDVAWWVPALVCWALVALLGIQSVNLNRTALFILLTAEVAIIVVYTIANFINPSSAGYQWTALDPSHLIGPGAGALLCLAVLGFIGFEAGVVYSEESKEPGKTVRRATTLAVAGLGLLYVTAILSVTIAVGPDNIIAAAREHDIGLLFNLAAASLGPAWADVGLILLVTSVVAAGIAFHNTVARYIFALGREALLPRALGRTSRKRSPRAASVTQSVTGLIVIVGFAVLGLDPLVYLFFYGGTTGGLGILMLLAFTAVAIVAYFNRSPDQIEAAGAWRTRVAPVLALLLMAIMLGLAVFNFADLLGTPPGSPLPYIIPAVYVLLGVGGTLWGIWLSRSRPDVHHSIGQGVKASLANPKS